MAKPTLQEAIIALRAHAGQHRADHQVARSIHVVLAALSARAADSPTSHRDHAAAEQSRRSDLARDVARAWFAAAGSHDVDVPCALADALDRLTAAYFPDGPKEDPS